MAFVSEDPVSSRARRPTGALWFLTSLCLILGAALVFVVWRPSAAGQFDPRDPEVIRQAAEMLARESGGVWDSFSDPDVGRILQANLEERPMGRIRVSSNAHGVRERAYELEKPAGTLRVVLLGDSYVFGNGVEADERFGVTLERELRERAGPGAPRIEVLHVGMTDWNIQSAASFLRRQLHLLRPDLVVHVLIYNDLDDASATRGFGGLARFSSQRRERADAILAMRAPFEAGGGGLSYLTAGLDYESLTRYAQAREHLERLATAVEASGARFLAVSHWVDRMAVADRLLLAGLPPEQVAHLPSSIFHDPALRISANDAHWNPAGHTRVAQTLYTWIRERNLLPELPLAPWPRAEAVAREFERAAAQELGLKGTPADWLSGDLPTASMDIAHPTRQGSRQVHGGLDRQGRIGPYASFVLANAGASHAQVRARGLDRPELDGARVRVFLDEIEVGELELRTGAELNGRWSIPEPLAARPFLSLRLIASDFVYAPEDLQHCIVLELRSIALVGG